VFHALGDLQDEPKDALPYYKQAYEQNDSNIDILYALATLSASKGVTEEAASIVQNVATKRVEDTNSSLLLSMLRKSVHRQGMAWDEMLAIFRVVLSLMESSPEIWPALHSELEKAIDKARTENEPTELAAYHLLLGAALYYIRQEVPDDLDKAATHWRAGLATVRNEVGFEEDDQLVYIEQHCLSLLGRLCVEKTLQERNLDPESSFQELQQAQESDRASGAVTALLASMYALTGQREKARDVLRVDMVTALNILVDDEDGNDWEGFASIRHQLVHTGDFENARRTNMLFPGRWFNVDIFKALLEDEESGLETASAQLIGFFEKERNQDDSNQDRFTKISTEVERLLAAAEPESSDAIAWTRISKILSGYNHFNDDSVFCNWCKETWNFEKGFNACKYCYDMDLCDKCLGDLRDGTPGAPYICSKLHDWIHLEPWNTQSYTRAWKRVVPVVAEDGSERLLPLAKWLGDLCDEWGLAKGDWDFE
jgi:tetratricopeptide (TPR) repeat protein